MKMKVDTFLDNIGDILQEDFSFAVLWTKAELLKYLREVLRVFSQRTMICDRTYVSVVDGTTGECDVPEDFIKTYFVTFDQEFVDLAQLHDMDFISGTWLDGSTGTPIAATQFGAGKDAIIRFVPVPSAVETGGGTSDTVYIKDSNDVKWYLHTDSGTIDTDNKGADATCQSKVVLYSTYNNSYWDLTMSVAGASATAASASTSSTTVELLDATDGLVYALYPLNKGKLEERNATYGVTTELLLNGVTQTFEADYGIITDAYVPDPENNTPTGIHLTDPIGLSLFGRTTDDTMFMYYKGHIQDVTELENEIFVSDSLIPILMHGVLARAYGHDGDGKDLEKSRLMQTIFELECRMIRGMFQRKTL